MKRNKDTYLESQILTALSLPPVTNLRTWPCPGVALTILPGEATGAQLTALTPIPCAWKIWCVQLLSRNSSTLTLPSEEAQARRHPASCGAQETIFTEAVWREKSKTRLQALPPEGEVALASCSRHINTLPSYDDEARIVPNLGCACDER